MSIVLCCACMAARHRRATGRTNRALGARPGNAFPRSVPRDRDPTVFDVRHHVIPHASLAMTDSSTLKSRLKS